MEGNCMELTELKYFTAVVDYGSFSKAASHIFVSQPTLSRTIQNLEKKLKVQLFERSTRTLILTDAGKLVYEQAKKIIEATNEIHTLLDDLMDRPSGEIKIGIPPLIGTLFFPIIAKKFGTLYPDVSLRLVEYGAKRIEHLINENEIDVGIVVLPTNTKKFDILPILKEEFMVFTSINHPLANRKSIELNELAQENFILFTPEFSLHNLIIEQCKMAGFYPNIVYESSQWDLITELVHADLGITLFPKTIFSKMNPEEMKAIPLQKPFLWELGVIKKKNQYVSFALRTLLQFLKEEFPLEDRK